ncbi:hypothetical protein N657DRAFT_615281 [Parathielavia appendiculata]|uniref:C2H2-type domain-containing protein n=1 Tax=Parathielavia appendiculata TaxID=2587402 RepID=A0AAN6Z608_9PEZI|nr:hypothetical protein N657DRAFT_615281 [Parathielavia appendiculata]
MEPSARDRSPISRRVAQKLGSDTTVRIPYRSRKDAAHARHTAAADLDTAITARHHDPETDPKRHRTAADALSLSGTTPPSSPTITSFPAIAKSMTPESTKAVRPQLVLIDSRGKVATRDGDDTSFRKHNRGIGSIDSILTSTTCVNTQSECSRAESRLSREIRIEVEDTDGGAPIAPPLRPRKQTSKLQLAPSSISERHSTGSCSESEDHDAGDEEARLVDEISSLVLRNTFGKDLDDCAAPLLVWDCTYRYLQELWTACEEGNLGFRQATSGHGTPSSHYGGTPGSANNDQQFSGQYGKGKRKVEGGDDDGGGLGGRDNQGNDGTEESPASQAYSTKGTFTHFSCPYRKRNPLRFNVRDHYVCATHSFADMSQLKKHIRAHHPPVQRNAGPFPCPRCCQGFVSKPDLDSHLRQPDVCRISFDSGGTDPEDGITQKIISSLEARSLKAKIDNWISLWKLLFPADQVIPDPVFVPVMEVFDFIAESKNFLSTLKDLLEIQYRHVLDGADHVKNVDMKIRQGLERSAGSIYTWIETVVQDWEHRLSGTMSLFTRSIISQPATSDSWASTPNLPPSPAPTPTVSGGSVAAASTLLGSESPVSTTAPGPRGPSVRRRPDPPPKRIKRPEILPKAPPPTQLPLPIQRARTPQSQARMTTNTFRAHPTVLPSQSIPIPPTTTQNLNSAPSYHTSWENPSVTVTSAYSVAYTSPGDVFQHPAMAPTHYPPMHPRELEVQPPGTYLAPEPSTGSVSPDAMQHDMEPRPQSTGTMHANRLTMSTTPRSSLASLSWIRDENRDSSQTLVEAHPPGRCHNLYCPSCNKTLPDDMAAQPSPVAIHPVTGAPHPAHAFQTAGAGPGAPFQASPDPGEIHNFADQIEWSFHASGGMPGAGGNDNMFGGGQHGPQEGY